jgi:DNA-binding transcriptional LysR family regulator
MTSNRTEDRVGMRLKFRDLQVFFTVVASGSMAEAARQLNLTQPAVSEIIAQLEHLFAARLFDRTTRGVEATIFGRALLARAHAALDEMRQGVRDIEFLADPTRGEVRIGCAQRLSAAIMPHIVERFVHRYPRVVLHIDELAPTRDLHGLRGLRERKYDLLMGRSNKPTEEEYFGDDVNREILFDDRFIVASAKNSSWARFRRIDLADLTEASWVLAAPDTLGYIGVARAFGGRGLAMPEVTVITSSVAVANHLLARNQAVTVTSKFAAETTGLHVLPIDLGLGPRPALVLTLRNRTLNPVAERFIACAREVIKSMSNRRNRRTRARPNVA